MIFFLTPKLCLRRSLIKIRQFYSFFLRIVQSRLKKSFIVLWLWFNSNLVFLKISVLCSPNKMKEIAFLHKHFINLLATRTTFSRTWPSGRFYVKGTSCSEKCGNFFQRISTQYWLQGKVVLSSSTAALNS